MSFAVSVWSDYYPELTLEEAAEKFLAVDLHYTELSILHLAKLLERGCPEQVGQAVQSRLSDRDFFIPQGHLSFAGGLCRPAALDRLKRELDLFAALGVRNAVLHFNGGNNLPDQERMDRRMEVVRKLRDYAKDTPVTLCLENLRPEPTTHTAQQLLAIIEAVGGGLGICLDTGHLHLTNGLGESQQTHREFILEAGDQLRALHITENNGKNDVHQMPFSARTGVNWQEVVTALREIGYEGLFNLEILGENKAPMYIRDAKLRYIKEMTDYMAGEDFPKAAVNKQ